MNKERILRLADHMDAQKPAKYNQGHWGVGVSSRKAEFTKIEGDRYQIVAKEGFCGSSACVLGHGATIPDMGLTMIAEDWHVDASSGRRYAGEVFVAVVDQDGIADPDINGYEAGSLALGVSASHAELMFAPGYTRTRAFYSQAKSYDDILPEQEITPQHVAAALREYVATGGASADEIIVLF